MIISHDPADCKQIGKITLIGYLTAYKLDLKFRDYYRYREYYCGLCRALGKRHGRRNRIVLGYDMAFLAILLDSVYDSETERKAFRCLLHPFSRHFSLSNPFIDYAADMDLYTAWLKCLDDWNDDRDLFRGAAAFFLRRKAKKIEAAYPEKTAVIREALGELHRFEEAGSGDFEGAAGCVGRALAEIFHFGGIWEEGLAEMGFYLGKYIYLLDAFEDLEEDIRKKRYNPFLEMSREEDFQEKVRGILKMMISRSAEEFELLPVDDNLALLRNIIYAGAWQSFEEIVRKKEGADPMKGKEQNE